MEKAQSGNKVKVSYMGILEDGTVFHQSNNDLPLEFTIGSHQLLPDFEETVVGMKIGETKKVTIEPQRAYGIYSEKNVAQIPRDKLPDSFNLVIGNELKSTDEEGNTIIVTVKDITDSMVIIDGNHPLAGKNIIFEITLNDIL